MGVNEYAVDEPEQEILYIGEQVREAQTAKLKSLRARRSNEAVERTLSALRNALAEEPLPNKNGLSTANTMPFVLDCVRAYATVGEICAAMRDVLGSYQESTHT